MSWCARVEKTIECGASTLQRMPSMAPGCDRLVLLKSAAARQCLARDCADRRRLRVANSDADADVPVVIVIFITVVVDGAESPSSISSLQHPRFPMSRAQ